MSLCNGEPCEWVPSFLLNQSGFDGFAGQAFMTRVAATSHGHQGHSEIHCYDHNARFRDFHSRVRGIQGGHLVGERNRARTVGEGDEFGCQAP